MQQGVSRSMCKGSNVPRGKVHPEGQLVTKDLSAVFLKKNNSSGVY